jgi:predicted RNase H-like HicB family nuclease
MKQKVANYTVVIEKEVRTGTKKACYSAYVPILGIATEGETVKQVQAEIKKLVEFHLESLAAEGEKNLFNFFVA